MFLPRETYFAVQQETAVAPLSKSAGNRYSYNR